MAKPVEWGAVMSVGDFEQGKEACRRLDEFARLAPYLGWCPPIGRRNVLLVWAEPLARLWSALQPVVGREREITQRAKKWDTFERLGQNATDFLKMRSGFPF